MWSVVVFAAAGFIASVSATRPNTQTLIKTLKTYGVEAKANCEAGSASEQLCPQLCAFLPEVYPSQVLAFNSTAYIAWDAEFWSQQQAEVQPACIFQPNNTDQVAVGLLLAELANCPFAVKSGGHAAFAGSSNVPNGLTIDLNNLNNITLSSDRTIASVGPGNRWVDVYDYLGNYNLSVIGGRVSSIGVGGLTLGGGISFFSQQYGWACDNVANFEVVLADGQIIDVNYESYPDLYFALRGGGNNFGIVTRFDLTTHSQGSLWSGTLTYLDANATELISAFVNYAANAPSDPNAALIFNFAYAESQFLVVADIEYAAPTENPPIYDNFTAIPAISNNLAVRTLPEVTALFESVNPNGLRESYWTATFQMTEDITNYLVNTFEEEVSTIVNVTGLLPALVLQVITTDMLEQMQKNGGNALGLSPSDGNLLLLNLSFMWDDAADDAAVQAVLGAITSKSIAYAKQTNVYNPYLYMNYASQYQAVIPSYGSANFKRLQQVSQKYDPYGILQTLQPGYFKLSTSAPDPNYP